MSDPVYDLGDADIRTAKATAAAQAAAGSPQRQRTGVAPRSFATGGAVVHPSAAWRQESSGDSADLQGYAVGSTFSLFVPGMGQVVRGRVDLGVLFMATFGLLGTLAWAAWTSQASIAETLPFLGLSRAWNIRALMIVYGVAGLLHVAAVVGSIPGRPVRRPAAWVLALASAVIPGWGQALAGRRWRTALCLGGLWTVGFAWFLASPAIQTAMAAQNLILPAGLVAVTGPLALYTGPAVLWAVAMSDAFHGRDRQD